MSIGMHEIAIHTAATINMYFCANCKSRVWMNKYSWSSPTCVSLLSLLPSSAGGNGFAQAIHDWGTRSAGLFASILRHCTHSDEHFETVVKELLVSTRLVAMPSCLHWSVPFPPSRWPCSLAPVLI